MSEIAEEVRTADGIPVQILREDRFTRRFALRGQSLGFTFSLKDADVVKAIVQEHRGFEVPAVVRAAADAARSDPLTKALILAWFRS